jgi:hypothetical protein
MFPMQSYHTQWCSTTFSTNKALSETRYMKQSSNWDAESLSADEVPPNFYTALGFITAYNIPELVSILR